MAFCRNIEEADNIKNRNSYRMIQANKAQINAICREHGIRKLFQLPNSESSELTLLGYMHLTKNYLDVIKAEIDFERLLKVVVCLQSDNMNYPGFLQRLLHGTIIIYDEHLE